MRIHHEASVPCHSRRSRSDDRRGPRPGRGLYFNPVAIRVSNSSADAGPFAFLGQNSTSQVFYGYDLGGYYDFFHAGKLAAGFDMRESDLHANNALLRSFLVGARVSAKPFSTPFKPYAQTSIGAGTTKAPASTVHISKLDYAIFGGVDYTLQHHVDFRVARDRLRLPDHRQQRRPSAAAAPNIPAANLISFSSGLVFRF